MTWVLHAASMENTQRNMHIFFSFFLLFLSSFKLNLVKYGSKLVPHASHVLISREISTHVSDCYKLGKRNFRKSRRLAVNKQKQLQKPQPLVG